MLVHNIYYLLLLLIFLVSIFDNKPLRRYQLSVLILLLYSKLVLSLENFSYVLLLIFAMIPMILLQPIGEEGERSRNQNTTKMPMTLITVMVVLGGVLFIYFSSKMFTSTEVLLGGGDQEEIDFGTWTVWISVAIMPLVLKLKSGKKNEV